MSGLRIPHGKMALTTTTPNSFAVQVSAISMLMISAYRDAGILAFVYSIGYFVIHACLNLRVSREPVAILNIGAESGVKPVV
ncbi:hypothetical protein BC1002_6588 [Paraburkholderia atlantica]|uniref:Uncharacterized protein n=2 Tax=Paraburkholderia atlantica TaxID=2654982 RepID=D5WMI3_PARAM|nr:hypothetical protein BC1002_6588 [Paraburkholderia atlantica]